MAGHFLIVPPQEGEAVPHMRGEFVTVVRVLSVLCLLPLGGQAAENPTSEQIRAVFYPYRQGLPRVDGIRPGMRIDHTNFAVARQVLPPEILQYVQAGDFAITVQETTDMPLRAQYIQATVDHHGQVQLGDVELEHYVAGLPFPLIAPHDPQAGEKVAWNYRYRDEAKTVQYWPTNEHRNRSGGVERAQSYYTVTIYGMHRPEAGRNIPHWEQQGIYSKQYMRTLAPSDLEGNQVLTYTYTQDTRLSDKWVYDPKSRRTRKVVDNPYDAPGGGELLMEDRRGFQGYIHAYTWKYLGEQVILAPGPIGATEPTWGGRGTWYPVDPWELRIARVVEATPKEPHPVYSRRLVYLDLQTSHILYALIYDHAGAHKRTFLNVYFHPAFNPWGNEGGIPQFAAQASIDYQWQRAGIFQTHKVVSNRPLNEHRLSVMGLMLYGK
jgi:hypothetical protein